MCGPLRDEIQAEKFPRAVFDGGVFGIIRDGGGGETARQPGKFVAVRIPDLQRFREICEQRATTAGHPQRPFAVFAFEAFLDLAAQKLGQQLHAVADAEHGQAEGKDFFVRQGCISGIHAGRTAGQDDAFGVQRGDFLRRGVEAQDLRIHVALADAARNDLRVLRAKVKDDNLFVHEIKNRNALFACARWFWRAKNIFSRRGFR